MNRATGFLFALVGSAALAWGLVGQALAAEFPEHRFVTASPAVQDMWPCFSPDGQTLLFTRTTDRKTWNLYTVPVAGGTPRPFPPHAPASGTRASWSPRSNVIAFNGPLPNGRFDLSLIHGDGSGLRRLDAAGISESMTYPSWYPDGKSIAVVDFSGDQQSAIKRIDIETGTVATQTDPATHWAGVPRVSPDGSRIVMGGQVRRGQRYSQYQNQLWILNREGELKLLDSQRGWAPFWSPDGQWIVFASDRGSQSGQWAIFIASPDGATVRQLTPHELNAGHPTWSPDGKLIAFFAQHSGDHTSDADRPARGLAVIDAAAALSLVSLRAHTDELAAFFRPPQKYEGDFGDYRSPLKFYDDRDVKSPEDWQARRQEILRRWHSIMGPWPSLIDKPRIEYVETERREDFTQHRIRIEVATDRLHPAILLVPDGKGPFPAAIVPYYEPETGAGLGKELRDFGYQLTKRGFVTLSIGGCQPRRDRTDEATIQRLTYEAYVAANCHTALANLPSVDAQRIGIVGHSYGGKWAMFASCLYDKFACAAWSDGGIVFDEQRGNVNYWEPWYLGFEPGREQRRPGIPKDDNPRTGAYQQLVAAGHDLHELHALMAPRPFLVSGGAEDQPERWRALNHAIAVNTMLGYSNRVAMTNRSGHSPTVESNAQIYLFFARFLNGEPASRRNVRQ